MKNCTILCIIKIPNIKTLGLTTQNGQNKYNFSKTDKNILKI